VCSTLEPLSKQTITPPTVGKNLPGCTTRHAVVRITREGGAWKREHVSHYLPPLSLGNGVSVGYYRSKAGWNDRLTLEFLACDIRTAAVASTIHQRNAG